VPHARIEYQTCREARFGVKPLRRRPPRRWCRAEAAADEFGVRFSIAVTIVYRIVRVVGARKRNQATERNVPKSKGFPVKASISARPIG